jgi:hypothetical protein
MPAYRFKGTPIVLQLTEENADAYNRVANAMTAAPKPKIVRRDEKTTQLVFKLKLENDSDMAVWDEVGSVINAVIKLGDGIPCDLPRDEAPTFIPV